MAVKQYDLTLDEQCERTVVYNFEDSYADGLVLISPLLPHPDDPDKGLLHIWLRLDAALDADDLAEDVETDLGTLRSDDWLLDWKEVEVS